MTYRPRICLAQAPRRNRGGDALLEHGDADGAIAKFTIANQKVPKFADPLEGWGEALIAKKLPEQALAKFEEADKYAPNGEGCISNGARRFPAPGARTTPGNNSPSQPGSTFPPPTRPSLQGRCRAKSRILGRLGMSALAANSGHFANVRFAPIADIARLSTPRSVVG